MVIRGYARVSTDEQAKNGQSIPAQQKILQAQATIKGYDDFTCYVDDGYSGKSLNRPAIQQLLQECREGAVDVVLVWKLDRLSRSLRDILTIIEDIFTPNGVTLISATESIDTSTPGGRAMLSVLGTFAQFEREQDSERVSMVHQSLAKDCRFLGGPVPLGYRIVDGHYQIDEGTAPIVRKLFDMYIARIGYTPMLAYLNGTGLRTVKGNPYGKNSLNYILSNERYVGTYIHNRLAAADARGHRSSSRLKDPSQVIRIPGGIPAIISKDVWESACAIRAENRIYSGRQSTRARFLLSGLCRCAVCGTPLIVNCGGTDRNGTRQRYYTCKHGCVPPARKERIEEAAFTVLDGLASSPELIDRACEVANQLAAADQQQQSPEIARLSQILTTLSTQIGNLTNALSSTTAPAPAAVLTEIARLEQEQCTIRQQIRALEPRRPYSSRAILQAANALHRAKEMPPVEVQTLLQAAFGTIAVSPTEYSFSLTGDCNVEMRTTHIIAIVNRRKRQQEKTTYHLTVTSDTFDSPNFWLQIK